MWAKQAHTLSWANLFGKNQAGPILANFFCQAGPTKEWASNLLAHLEEIIFQNGLARWDGPKFKSTVGMRNS